MKPSRLLLSACLLLATAAPAHAADTTALPAVNALATAQDLARLGEARDDALMMTVAARMILAQAPAAADGQPDPLRARADHLLLRAESLSEMKPELLTLIEESRLQDTTRGLVGNEGVRRKDALVKAGETDVYPLLFEGDEDAAIVLWGDGAADIDLQVLGKRRKVACSSAASPADEQCRWAVPKRAEYRVRVINRGNADSRYVLLFN